MRLYTLIVLLCASTSIFSQKCNYKLQGTVIDIHDNTLLADALLTINNFESSFKSDSKGNYIITNLCKGNYNLQVSHPSCDLKSMTIKIDGNTKKNIKLEHHLEELNQIRISAKAYSSKNSTSKNLTLNSSLLEDNSSKSLGDILNTLSGVSSLNTGNTIVKPIINGLHSSRITIINDGVRLQDQEWGAEHAPNIDVNTIGNITVIKGASALQYSGDAIGGVIINETQKTPVKDTIYGKTNITAATNGRGGTLNSQLTKTYKTGWYTTLQASLKRYGDYETPKYVLSNTGLSSQNGSLKLGYNNYNYGFEAFYSYFKNEIGILNASHLGGAEDQIRALASDSPLIINDFTYTINAPKQKVTHQVARLKLYKNFNGFGKLSLQYDYQNNNRLEFDNRRGIDDDQAALDLDLKTHALQLNLKSKLSTGTNLKAGIITSIQDNFSNPNTGIKRLIPDYDLQKIGGYIIIDHTINDNLLLEAGTRIDYTKMDVYKFYRTSFWESRNYDTIFPELVIETYPTQILTNPKLDYTNISATLGARYNITKNLKLYVNYALASRPPNVSELFSEGLHQSASRIELGDLQFNSEISQKLSLTIDGDYDNFSFSVQPFSNTITDFIVIEPTGVQQTIRGNFQVWEYRQTNARLLGVDVDTNFKITDNFNFINQLSVVKGYDNTLKTALINFPPVNTTNQIVYQNQKLNNLSLGLTSEYHFKQNEYPNTNFEIFNPITQSNQLIDISTPPNAYHLLHFNSKIDFDVFKHSKLSLGLTVQNILNTNYRNYLNRFRFYADDLGRSIQLNINLNY